MIYIWTEATGMPEFPFRVCLSAMNPDTTPDDKLDELDANTVRVPMLRHQSRNSLAYPLVNVLQAGAPGQIVHLGER
jgi:hypothetical protein